MALLSYAQINTPGNQISLDVPQPEPTNFTQFAISWRDKIDNENSQEELQRIKKWVRNLRAYRGESRGFIGPAGEFIPLNPDKVSADEASLLLVNNQFRLFTDTLAAQWSRSNPRQHCNAVPETDECRAGCRFADKLISLYQRKHLTASFRQREAKYNLLCGNAFRYVCFAKTKDTKTIQVPGQPVEQPFTLFEGGYMCPDCDYAATKSQHANMTGKGGLPEGSPEEEAMESPEEEAAEQNNGEQEGQEAPNESSETCPECGSKLDEMPSVMGSKTVYMGMEKKNLGDVFTESPDPIEVKVHLTARDVDSTPYIRWKRRILHTVLQSMYPNIKITGRIISQVSRYGQELESSTGNQSQVEVYNQATYDYVNMPVEFDQVWLDKELYWNNILDRDTTGLPPSQTNPDGAYPAGTPFTQIWPDGMYIAIVGNLVVDNQNEDKNCKWSHSGYLLVANSFWFDGLEDGVQLQQYLNEMQSLNVENVMHNAAPKLVVNPNLVEPSSLSGKPRDVILMSSKSSRDSEPGKAIQQLQGMSCSQELQVSAEFIIASMKNVFKAKDEIAGDTDPHNQTARGQAIARNQNLILIGPPLELNAEASVEWCYQILEHVQANWFDGRYKDIMGYYDDYEEECFKNLNIREQIEITVEDGSWLPRTMEEVRENFIAFATAEVNGLPNGFLNEQVPLEIRKKAAELLQIDFDSDALLKDERNAYFRINQLKAMVRSRPDLQVQLGQQPDPNVVQMLVEDDNIKPDVVVDNHQVFIATYTDWLKTDDAREANKYVTAAVRLLINLHMQAIVQLKQWQAQQMQSIASAGMGQNTGLTATPPGAGRPQGPPSANPSTPPGQAPQPPTPGMQAMPGIQTSQEPGNNTPGAVPPSELGVPQ